MCEFLESTYNGFGEVWWTDNPIYFSSRPIDVVIWSGHQLATMLALKVILVGIIDSYCWSGMISANKSLTHFHNVHCNFPNNIQLII